MATPATAGSEALIYTKRTMYVRYSPTKERALDVARDTKSYPAALEYTEKEKKQNKGGSPDVLLGWHFQRKKEYEK